MNRWSPIPDQHFRGGLDTGLVLPTSLHQATEWPHYITTNWPQVAPQKAHAWWRHQMEIFSAFLSLCAGNSPVPGEFPAQRPMPRSFDVFFELRLNKQLNKQSWGWWFETRSRSLWRHRNEVRRQANIFWPPTAPWEGICVIHFGFLSLMLCIYISCEFRMKCNFVSHHFDCIWCSSNSGTVPWLSGTVTRCSQITSLE